MRESGDESILRQIRNTEHLSLVGFAIFNVSMSTGLLLSNLLKNFVLENSSDLVTSDSFFKFLAGLLAYLIYTCFIYSAKKPYKGLIQK